MLFKELLFDTLVKKIEQQQNETKTPSIQKQKLLSRKKNEKKNIKNQFCDKRKEKWSKKMSNDKDDLWLFLNIKKSRKSCASVV